MTDQGAAEHDAVFVVNGDAGLAAHFLNGRGGDGKVIRRAGTEFAGMGCEMLEVRQVDVDDAFQHTQGFHGLIAGGVPDQRKRRAPELQRLQDAGHEGCAGDKG